MSRVSQRTNRKLRAIALEVAQAGAIELPRGVTVAEPGIGALRRLTSVPPRTWLSRAATYGTAAVAATSGLWERIASSASDEEDTLLREEVVLLNLSVAVAIAARYRSKGIPLDDLRQVASLGLVKAANGFDPTVGRDFLSYAVPTISGEVKRHFRDRGWTVRPPRRVQELQARISSISADSTQSPGSLARPAEVAARLGVDVSEVIEALTCNGFSPMSLDSRSVSQDPRPRSVTCSARAGTTTATPRT